MFENLKTFTIPRDRRKYISRELDAHPDYKITDIMMLDIQERTWVLEVINGTINDGQTKPEVDGTKIRQEMFTLRTVDGEPLKNIKVGITDGYTTKESKRLHMMGDSEYEYKDFPAQFQCSASLAVYLLSQYGYGMVYPRHFRRHALSPAYQHKCADGTPVVARDRWKVVEVGSMFEERARKEGEIKPLKKGRE